MRSASQPTGRSTTRSTTWASARSCDTPGRSSPNSRVPLIGMRNWLTDDHTSAMMIPTANISQTMGGARRADDSAIAGGASLAGSTGDGTRG